MTARSAKKELQLEGAIEVVAGLVTLVLAIVMDAPAHWVLLVVAALGLCATAYPARWQRKAVQNVQPAPDGLRVVSALRRVPLFLASAMILPFLGVVAPFFFWAAAIVAIDGAITLFVRAAVIGRAERRRGGRIVRANEDTFGDQYFVLAH